MQNDTRHNGAQRHKQINATLSLTIKMWHQRNNKLSVTVTLSRLSVIMLDVVILSVVAPLWQLCLCHILTEEEEKINEKCSYFFLSKMSIQFVKKAFVTVFSKCPRKLRPIFKTFIVAINITVFGRVRAGSAITNGREPRSFLGRVFNSKLGRIATLGCKCMVFMQTLLKLKTRPKARPVI